MKNKLIVLFVTTLMAVGLVGCPIGPSHEMSLVYSETFDSAGGWWIADDATVATALVGSTYAMTQKQAGYTHYSTFVSSDSQSLKLSGAYKAEFQLKPSTTSTTDGSASVHFDYIYNNSTDFSYMKIGFCGTYFDVWQYSNNATVPWTQIQAWTSTPALLPGDWNTVTLVRNADSYELYINGQACGTWQSVQPITPAMIAIGVGKFSVATSDFTAYFDNLKVYQ